MERLYQHRPYMVESMYVVGVKPKSLGEGVIPVVHTMDYTKAWLYWDAHPGHNYGIFQWSQGTLLWVGRKVVDKKGRVYRVPVPPWNIELPA